MLWGYGSPVTGRDPVTPIRVLIADDQALLRGGFRMLLGERTQDFVYEAMRVGASGFLVKDTPPAQLAAGIPTVAAGDALLAPGITRRLIEEFVHRPAPGSGPPALAELTEREVDVLRRLARGLSNAEIAGELVVSEATVKTHVAHVLRKLDLRDRVQAVVYAYESGLVQPGA